MAPQFQKRWVMTGLLGLVSLALLLALSLGRIAASERRVGYAAHVDERHLLGSASGIIETGDWNPHFFRYPSLPIYMATLSIKAGEFFSDAEFLEGEEPFAVHYETGWAFVPRAVYFPARVLWGALGAGAMVMVFFITVQLLPRTSSLGSRLVVASLAAALLGCSPVLQKLSVNYLNVDTPTVFFSTACLAWILHVRESGSFWKMVLVPAVLAGAVTACKYNSGLILMPALLAITWGSGSFKTRLRRLASLGGLAAVTFFLCVPYALLDTSAFIKDVVYEVNHYYRGHPEFEAEPGLEQLAYYLNAIVEQIGSPGALFALLGLGFLAVRDGKLAAIVASFPLLMLLHMSCNRVHFLRTVAPLFALVPALSALGIYAIVDSLLKARGQSKFENPPQRLVALGSGFFVLLSALSLGAAPHESLFDLNMKKDSRRLAAETLSVLKPTTLYISSDLCFSPEDFEALGARSLDPRLSKSGTKALRSNGGTLLLPQYEKAKAKGPAKKKLIGYRKRRKRIMASAETVVEWGGKKLAHPLSHRSEVNCPSNPRLALIEVEPRAPH